MREQSELIYMEKFIIFKKFFRFVLCGSMLFSFQVSAVNVKDMTLDEKLGQMLCLSFKNWGEKAKVIDDAKDIADFMPITEINGDIKDIISRYHIGGVVLFAPNLVNPEQSVKLVKDLQNAAIKSGTPSLIIAVDQEGGRVERFSFGRSRLKNNAEIKTSKEAFEKGSLIAQEMRKLGMNCDFAPVVDVNSNPYNPVINVRSFGDNADDVSELGKSFLGGLHSENVIGTAKHFPGHGDTNVDSHVGLPVVNKSLSDLEKLELKPFKALSDAGVDMMMVAHIALPKIETKKFFSNKTGKEIYLPASLSKTIIDGILRNKIGFKGVIVTDAMNMKALADNFSINEASKMAIQAGADMLCMPVIIESRDDVVKLEELFKYLKKAIVDGEISKKQIDASVERILKLKEKYCK